MDNQSITLSAEEIKKQLNHYSKQKDDLIADTLRIEGILLYLNNELKKLTEKNIDNPVNNS